MKLRKIGTNILDLIYPPSLYCNCCGNIIDESRTYNLCDHCIKHIKWDGDEIREVKGLKTIRCTEYGIYERTLIFQLKYNGKKYIARDLAEMAKDRLSLEDVDFDVIIPVPMFHRKEMERGFNQAALIGKHLAYLTGKQQIDHVLIRTLDTKPMRGLNPSEREINVKDTFSLDKNCVKMLEGKRVLLIDDFFTTGSTARECQRELLKAMPEDILFLAFAARF